jgi:S-adenosylmethionine:tRNA ribosyltransferase-isomerase
VRLEELDFEFPEELIAQRPCEPRDACRLLVADPAAGSVDHRVFVELPSLLRAGDVLVVNESKVLPARAWARKATGGLVELLFLKRAREEPAPPAASASETWEVLARPSARLRPGQPLFLAGGEELTLADPLGDGRWTVVRNEAPGVTELLHRHGVMPLPPYIRTPLADPNEYQTVYASVFGSAAAPTAGLHFTTGLLGALDAAGIHVERVTLHVGVDTFRPVTEDVVERHAIHSETYCVETPVLARLDTARAEGRRLVAVGTTSVRVLETLYRDSAPGAAASAPPMSDTSVFITPGYGFRAVDALLTNFHLPRTSLLALVMAFGGIEFVRRIYRCAIEERYRFFSFGDAMFLPVRAEVGS